MVSYTIHASNVPIYQITKVVEIKNPSATWDVYLGSNRLEKTALLGQPFHYFFVFTYDSFHFFHGIHTHLG
jgi:hypothetical protein